MNFSRVPPTLDVPDPVSEEIALDEFSRYRRLARQAMRAPVAHLFLLVGEEGPSLSNGPDSGDEAPLAAHSWVMKACSRVATSQETAAVADARRHRWSGERRGESGSPGVAYLGVPLLAPNGESVGALCVLDSAPREWTTDEVELLTDLAHLVAREVALRREALERRALENLVRVLGKAVENMQLGVTVTDMEGRIIYTNPAEAHMHGFEVGELVGKHARILGPPELTRPLDGEHLQYAASWTRESVNLRKDGSRFPVLLWSDLVTDKDGKAIGIVTCCEDITERKHAEQTLRDVALRDPLTALPNRVYFLERLTQAIQHARHTEAAQFAVLFLDLDRFKIVNDSLGHHVGDELLAVIAKRLHACLRPTDTIARFGGDEFAVLLENIEGTDDAIRVAQRLQDALASPIQLNGYELFTSASIGIVLSSPLVDQPEYLWRSADMAMYRAKASGTGRFEVFDRAMHADALARLQLETDLRRAVEREEFELFYQPVVALGTGSVVGFEALLRWQHPLRGIVSPAEVIPTAEETGLILPIGEWVLHRACRQLGEWKAQFGSSSPVWVGVNLSSKQLAQPNLLQQVQSAIEAGGIEAHELKLEITESAVVENTEAATETLSSLKQLGVKLFMDDFGTGYSSLSYLHRLPLDALKIDRSFVSQMERGDQHAHLVETILSLAQSVGVSVVAEGVSTPDQLAILRELQCELGQGFLFSHPLPANQAEQLLRDPPSW